MLYKSLDVRCYETEYISLGDTIKHIGLYQRSDGIDIVLSEQGEKLLHLLLDIVGVINVY